MSQKTFPPIDPEQPAFLRLPVRLLPFVIARLIEEGERDVAQAVKDFTRDYTDPEANANRLGWIERADGVDNHDEIEFDSDSTISHSEDGEYVLGWAWVPAPDEEESDELTEGELTGE